jgi:hypothetical protein
MRPFGLAVAADEKLFTGNSILRDLVIILKIEQGRWMMSHAGVRCRRIAYSVTLILAAPGLPRLRGMRSAADC